MVVMSSLVQEWTSTCKNIQSPLTTKENFVLSNSIFEDRFLPYNTFEDILPTANIGPQN